VRSRIPHLVLPSELGEFGEEVRRIFRELGRGTGMAGECSPPIDVYETDDAMEICVDLPAVDAADVRVAIKGATVLIAGEKTPPRGRGDSSFHLVERGFGRFARTVGLSAACDASRARATLRHGELRITLPKIGDRRGRLIEIAIDQAPAERPS
jgi:HSP20 family protein